MNPKLVSKHPALLTATLVVIAALLLAACSPAATTVAPTDTPVPKAGSGQAFTPAVTVADQAIAAGAVTIADVVSNGPGWIVIHIDNSGKPGAVIGYAAVANGDNPNILVEVDATKATATLYAMLHVDAGTVGAYEFPGADVPAMVNGNMVSPSFTVSNPAAGGAMVNMANTSALGNFLVDSKGMTLYLFTKDTPGVSNCSGGCLASWPALLTTGTPVAGTGVDASRLGTITRADGSTQVTYNNVPLYYFIKDKAAGDTFGQGVGSVWYVVAPDGTAITTSAAPSSTATTAPAGPYGTTTTAPAAAAVMVNMTNTTALGNFLVDSKGMTLYMFTKDTPGVSNCTGGCAGNWPPLLATGVPTSGSGVDASKLGTITRSDGSKQVTYNNEPLYYFAGDKNPGDTTGQGVGSVWYVVAP